MTVQCVQLVGAIGGAVRPATTSSGTAGGVQVRRAAVDRVAAQRYEGHARRRATARVRGVGPGSDRERAGEIGEVGAAVVDPRRGMVAAAVLLACWLIPQTGARIGCGA